MRKMMLRKDLPLGVFFRHDQGIGYRIYISVPKSTSQSLGSYHCILASPKKEENVFWSNDDSPCYIFSYAEVVEKLGVSRDWWNKYLKMRVMRRTIQHRLP